ncbi:MAG: mannosyl-3-phosphoglycerate synthase [Desulfurococcaceae archaeon]
MLIGYPARFEVFGAVKIYELSKIHTLFSIGVEGKPGAFNISSFRELENIMSSTVFVVPVKNEDPASLEGVLRAIPHGSPVIVVSNSQKFPLNIYKLEQDIAKMLYKTTGRTIIVVHQKDQVIADRLREALPLIIDEKQRVRDGKGEGMLIGVLLADALRAENVAFVDADNYIPSVVLEYALIFYTALSASESKYKMVRIYWSHKAWFAEQLYLRRTGRASTLVNSVFNKILSFRQRKETDIIKTSNSGEHAMSIELARELIYGGGFSAETQELVGILEKCYLNVDRGLCKILPENIEIYQVESISPHIHAEKGESHIFEMVIESLSAIYNSELPDERGKRQILDTLRDLGFVGEPLITNKYDYPEINVKNLLDTVVTESNESLALGI